MTASRPIDRSTFLANVRQSGLLSAEQLAGAAHLLPESNRGTATARALVEHGLLTRFQAERLLVGRTAGFLLGQYRILEQIGRGGMGRVFKAEHRTMKRIVALKVLAPNLLATERSVALFLHEVRAVAQLVHPNIVTAYDANEVNGRHYLVLEYVDGPNLEQLVRSQGPLSVGLACDYVRQAAHGLQCAHALGMIHRDIKPANIMVQWHGLGGADAPGLVKVSDFGLARLHVPAGLQPGDSAPGTILTADNVVMGTPDYLSPEQARNLHKTDIRGDLYSLGCTFHFLLTGQVPFPGGSAVDKLIRHNTDTPQPISAYRADVPAAVLAIVERLLAKNPEDRFQTPAELAEALAPYAVSGPTPWAPPRPPALELELGPEDLVEEDEDIVPSAAAERPGQTATLSSDLSPTPGLAPEPVAALLRRDDSGQRLRWAVLLAVALTAGLAALLTILGILAGG
jgi:serine/threonine protein kinase